MLDPRFVGLDFGTTNSALAIAGAEGPAALVRFRVASGPPETFRSILFFDEYERTPAGAPFHAAGPEAFDAYFAPFAEGRLVQSLKTHLTSAAFTSTVISGRGYSLEELVALILEALAAGAGDAFELAEDAAVAVGRPVRFKGEAGRHGDGLALQRLRAACAEAGFANVAIEYEPLAAAYHYEEGLDRDELVLIGDFGGGTSDFCLMHVGPGPREERRLRGGAAVRDIFAGVSGVGVGGDSFDARIIGHCITPRLGRGTRFRNPFGKSLPVPEGIYQALENWHLLSFLDTAQNRRVLRELVRGAEARREIEALRTIVESRLGFHLYRAVEAAKIALSDEEEVAFTFDQAGLRLEARITRAAFERWIAPELRAIGRAVDELVDGAEVAAGDIDRVFLTGGSSFLPAIRRLFADRFGAEKLVADGASALTSVASGLALAARDRAER